jgi:hypothetical protein
VQFGVTWASLSGKYNVQKLRSQALILGLLSYTGDLSCIEGHCSGRFIMYPTVMCYNWSQICMYPWFMPSTEIGMMFRMYNLLQRWVLLLVRCMCSCQLPTVTVFVYLVLFMFCICSFQLSACLMMCFTVQVGHVTINQYS